MILDKIIEQKKIQLVYEKQTMSMEDLEKKINHPEQHQVLDFYAAIKEKPGLSIIAEVKKASPSKGIICENFDPEKIAEEYCESRVEAISVLTEKNFFMGNDENLVKIRKFAGIPLLRKDFIIDLWQIYQSRWLGADAILLIVSALADDELKSFQQAAGDLGLHCLVEVHDRRELERALESGAKIIGINNRDLKTFEVNMGTTERLMGLIPKDRAIVSESGINTAENMKYLKQLGVDGVLIGETFMRSGSIRDKIIEFRDV